MKFTMLAVEANQISKRSENLIPIPNAYMVIYACAKVGCTSTIIDGQSFDKDTEIELKEMGFKVKKISNKLHVSWE